MASHRDDSILKIYASVTETRKLFDGHRDEPGQEILAGQNSRTGRAGRSDGTKVTEIY